MKERGRERARKGESALVRATEREEEEEGRRVCVRERERASERERVYKFHMDRGYRKCSAPRVVMGGGGDSGCRESIVNKLPSSFSARWRLHRAPMMPEQGESMCARRSDKFAT